MLTDNSEQIIQPPVPTNSLYTTYQWEKSTPSEEGFDESLLEDAFSFGLLDGTFTQAAVVVRNEKIVYEDYRNIGPAEIQILQENEWSEQLWSNFEFRDSQSLTSSWSMAKSFVSILIGIAIDKGFIESIESPAADFLFEWQSDERNLIKIKDLLNMRSGLVPVCRDVSGSEPIVCTTYPGSGGDILPFTNITEVCINRQIAEVGVIQPWFSETLTWEENYFLYINCDTQVLGELLERAVGSDLETFAEVNLFSKIGFDNYWWRDASENFTAYCCLDATPRDFAKLGQLMLNYGAWGNEQIISREYIETITSIYPDYIVSERGGNWSYGMQFWTLDFPRVQSDGVEFPTYPIYYAAGYDGQFIIIDYEKNLVIVRNSLYFPLLGNDERIVKLTGDLYEEVAFPLTLPNTLGIPIYFNSGEFVYKVHKSIK